MRHVVLFADLTPKELSESGGKGGTLAKLYQRGLPVPNGCVILPHAFSGDELCVEAAAELKIVLATIQPAKRNTSFAVRSSAMGEDSSHASFAGGFLSILKVSTDLEILAAVHAVRRSAGEERVTCYAQTQGLTGSPKMAVVVQELVEAELAGVMFCQDPLSSDHKSIVGNYTTGLGEALVAGDVDTQNFSIDRRTGKYLGPKALYKHRRTFRSIALRLESELGYPQDIEWAIKHNTIYILQSRPITTLSSTNWYEGYQPEHLWSCGNAAEALPEVLTPLTWSLWKIFHCQLSPIKLPGTGEFVALIGGRAYFNFSLMYSLSCLKQGKLGALRSTEEFLGKLPLGTTVPTVAIPKGALLRAVLANVRWERRYRQLVKALPDYLRQVTGWCNSTTAEISTTTTAHELATLWESSIRPQLTQSFLMVRVSGKTFFDLVTPLGTGLEELLGPSTASTLLSNMRGPDNTGLASIGPLLGLAQLSRGEIDQAQYIRHYGHRGPNEAEVAAPRPVEDPSWLDRQLREFAQTPLDVSALLDRQQSEFAAALERLQRQHPTRAPGLTAELNNVAQAAQLREAARSECIRVIGVVRSFAVRVGKLTGLGDDIFFLTNSEMIASLLGRPVPFSSIKNSRLKYMAFKALPPYPTLVRGQFDPFRWAADPMRRSDLADGTSKPPVASDSIIRGYPGSFGIIEGTVRVLNSPEEGHELKTGEILVAKTTNVGWTLLFPRVSAIITDIGAPLSHAAIVARELGIPAVLGCGTATTRLKTGDRVLVNGATGEVTSLGSGLTF